MPIPILDPGNVVRSDGGSLNPRIADDARLSKAQLDALSAVAAEDEEAAVVGLDARGRPVVRARHSGPGTLTLYSLLRDGSPTAVAKSMIEAWTDSPRMKSRHRRAR